MDLSWTGGTEVGGGSGSVKSDSIDAGLLCDLSF